MGDHLDEYFNHKTPLVKDYIYDMVVHRFLAVGHVVTEAIPCVS
jgi:NAD-dependent DNA ligase